MTEVQTAQQRAAGAAPASVTIELVHGEREAREAVGVLAEVWPRADGKEPLPAELAWVFAHSGNYVALARAGGEPVAATVGFRGADERGVLLHSHITGVRPQWQGARVGYALKQHQRTWALEAGIDRITWTFDPLVARNAYFNVVKLGAHIVDYYVDFYGPMDDGINRGDETDRCLVEWRLTDGSAIAAVEGNGVTPAANGAAVVLAPDADERPCAAPQDGPVRLARLPIDIVELRQRDPAVARAWRLALRDVLLDSFAAGLAVVGVHRDATYVLARPSATAG